MVTASKIRSLDDFTGDASLYKLSEPVAIDTWDDDETTTEFVVVSAAVVPFSGPETYIFAANEQGEITSWSEMRGSYKGGLQHEEAILRAGWTVVS